MSCFIFLLTTSREAGTEMLCMMFANPYLVCYYVEAATTAMSARNEALAAWRVPHTHCILRVLQSH